MGGSERLIRIRDLLRFIDLRILDSRHLSGFVLGGL